MLVAFKSVGRVRAGTERRGYSMVSFRARLAKLDKSKAELEALEASGVDLTSDAASAAVLEFIYALDDLAQEFGYKLIKQQID